MKYSYFTIYDRVASTYSEPFGAVNVPAAQRRFDFLMQNAPMVSPDCQLFYIGDFETETGEFISIKPQFVQGYAPKLDHKEE